MNVLYLTEPYSTRQEVPFAQIVSESKIDLALGLRHFYARTLLAIEQRKGQVVCRILAVICLAWIIGRAEKHRGCLKRTYYAVPVEIGSYAEHCITIAHAEPVRDHEIKTFCFCGHRICPEL